MKHSLWSDLISSGWPSAYWPNQLWSLRMSRSILPVSSSFLVGSAAKQPKWLVAFFCLFFSFLLLRLFFHFGRVSTCWTQRYYYTPYTTMDPRNDQSGNIHAFESPWSMLRFHFNGFCLMNGLVLTAVQFTLGCQSSYVVELACSFHYSLPLDY